MAIPTSTGGDISGSNRLPFNSLIIGNPSHYNTSLFQYIVPVDGVYYFNYQSEQPTSTSGTISDLVRSSGGVVSSFRTQVNSSTTQGSFFFGAIALFDCLAGDLIYVQNKSFTGQVSRVASFSSRFIGFKVS